MPCHNADLLSSCAGLQPDTAKGSEKLCLVAGVRVHLMSWLRIGRWNVEATMVRVDVTTLISRPVQEVWDFFIDFTNSSHWTRSGSELRATSAGPFGVGTTLESVRTMFGREIKSQTLVVTHYDPGRRVSFTAEVAILGHLVGGFTFESMGTETRLSRWTQLGGGGPRELLGRLLLPLVRRSQGTELANLKRLIEARA